MNDEDLSAIRAREQAATKGPWRQTVSANVDIEDYNGNSLLNDNYAYECVCNFTRKDAEFIVHARTDVPLLLAEVDRLREMLTWCDQHMSENVPPLPDFSGPDLGWQERRLQLRALTRSPETQKAE